MPKKPTPTKKNSKAKKTNVKNGLDKDDVYVSVTVSCHVSGGPKLKAAVEEFTRTLTEVCQDTVRRMKEENVTEVMTRFPARPGGGIGE